VPPSKERQNIQVRSERVVLAALRLPESVYDHRDPFGELRELTEQAGGTVVGELEQRRDRPEAGTYMGKGKVEELKALCDALDATTVIFDHELSPKQIATIEKIVGRKILDRSELILDIFAGRATTHEAQLQVELAQLEYTYPRLRAMWSHLERISAGAAGGGVGTRGPGEQQLEIDRRLVQRRKIQLQRELAEIQDRKRRAVRQRNIENETVGLVGYTNAGKSTIFNTFTEGGAYADDRVFATLSTRTRRWDLGGGVGCLLSDTVGFVRELPHHLVASFRATLEEATHADLLIVVLDVSDPSVELHHDTVTATLDELFAAVEKQEARDKEAPPYERPEILTVLNKADRLRDNRDLLYWQARIPGSIPLCALPPSPEMPEPVGHAELTERVRSFVVGPVRELDLSVPMSDPRTIDAIERRCEVLGRDYRDDRAVLRTRIGARQLARLRSAGGPGFRVYTPEGELVERESTRSGWRR
jgi:GTP-binding protein HflX